MNSKNAVNYENVVIRKEQEVGINNFGLDYLVGLEDEIERLNNRINEAIEYIERNKQKIISAYGDNFDDDFDIALDEEDIDNILDILDKGEE